MNRTANRLAMAGLLLAISCGSGTLVLGSTYTLQGVVADAITGARVGGDLKLFLIQGPEVRGPSRLIVGTTDPLMGEYAFTGIPVAYVAGNNTWKVVAVKSGYQRFESEVTFTAATVALGGGTNAILDQAFSKIGNIFLFPIGITAPDYKFTTTYNGKPVPGATVDLDPISASNSSADFTEGTGDTLPANNGYVPALSATTDASGVASFAGTLLAVGASYKPVVLPVAFKETTTSATIQLANNAGTPAFIAGLGGNTDQHIALAALAPSPAGVPLYVATESNFITGSLQTNGNLVVTFSIPVTVASIDGYVAALNPGTKPADGSLGTGALNATKPVNASLSTDGLTLTLAPNYSTAPAGNERGLSITYGDSSSPPAGAPPQVGVPLIEAKDYPGVPFVLFGPVGAAPVLKLTTGAAVNPKVQMVAP